MGTTPAIARWQRAADVLNHNGWFLPAYITGQAVFRLVDTIESSDESKRRDILKDELHELYAPRHLSSMYLYRYKSWPYVSEFAAQIFECIEAAHYGFLRTAVVSLIPVLEGIARLVAKDFVAKEKSLRSKPKILVGKSLDSLSNRAAEASHPSVSEEVRLLVSSYQRFFRGRFYKDVRKREDGEDLLRHALLHGVPVGPGYGNFFNFYRLVSVLDLYCLLFTLVAPREQQLSILAPRETEESRLLADYLGVAMSRRFTALRQLSRAGGPSL